MKNRFLFIAACLIFAVAGCASQDYALYADGQAKSDTARHNADAAKYKAMADIASTGTDSAKVAAVMALALGGAPGQVAHGTGLQAPQQSSALQWAQVLVPGLTQIAGIHANMQVAATQSNNAARVAESTNASFVGIAGQIQSPAANVTTSNATTTALSGTGNLGAGSYATTDGHNTAVPLVVTPTVLQPVILPSVTAP